MNATEMKQTATTLTVRSPLCLTRHLSTTALSSTTVVTFRELTSSKYGLSALPPLLVLLPDAADDDEDDNPPGDKDDDDDDDAEVIPVRDDTTKRTISVMKQIQLNIQ